MVRRIRPANEDADDALIGEAVERASWEQFTREPPKTLQGRINFLLEQLKTTKAVAQELGVSRRSVERYRKGERKHPPRALADRIDAAVRTRWQPRVRSQRQKHAATTGGITVEARARFGYDAPAGPTDDGRSAASPSDCPPPTPSGCSTPSKAVAPSHRTKGSPKDSKRSTSKQRPPRRPPSS